MRSHASQVTTQPADSKGLSHEVKPIAARSKLSLPTFFAHDQGREEQYFSVPWLRLTGERNPFFLAETVAIFNMLAEGRLYTDVARIILQYMGMPIHHYAIHYDRVNNSVTQYVPDDAVAMAENHNRTELAHVFGKRYHNQLGIYAEDLGVEEKHHRIRLDICLAQEPQMDVDFVLFVNINRNINRNIEGSGDAAVIASAINFYRQFAAQENPNARFSLYAFNDDIISILFKITYKSMSAEDVQRKIIEGLDLSRINLSRVRSALHIRFMPVIDELCKSFIKQSERLRVFWVTGNGCHDDGYGIEGHYSDGHARELSAELYYRIQCATVEGALYRLSEQVKDRDKKKRIEQYCDPSMIAKAVKGEISLPDELNDLLQMIENPHEQYVAHLQLQGSMCRLEMNMVGVELSPRNFLLLNLVKELGNRKSKCRNVTVKELPDLAKQYAHDFMLFDDPIPLTTAVYNPNTKQQGRVISHATGTTNEVNTIYVEYPVSQVKDQKEPIEFKVFVGPKVGRVAVKLQQNQLQPNSEAVILHRRAVITNALQFGCDIYPWQGQLITALTYNQHWLKYHQFRQEVEQTPGYGLQLLDEVKEGVLEVPMRNGGTVMLCIFTLPPKPTVERSHLLHQSIDRTKLSEAKWFSDHPRVAAMIDLWRFLESDRNRFVFAGESFTFAQCAQLHDENGFVPGGEFELFIEKLIILRNILADAMRHQCSIVHLSQVFLAHARTLLKKFSDSPNEEFDRKIQKLLESFAACEMELKHHNDYLIVVPNTWVRVKKSNGEVQVMDLQASGTEQIGTRKIAVLSKTITDYKLEPNSLNKLMQFYLICNDNGWLSWLGTTVRKRSEALIKDRIQLAEFLIHVPAGKQDFASYLLELHKDIIVGPTEKVKSNALSTGYFDLLRNYMSINANPVHTYVQTNLLREFVKQFQYLQTNRQSELVNFYCEILLIFMSQGTSAEYYDRIKLLFVKYYLEIRMNFQKKYGGAGSDFGDALQTVLRNVFKLDMPKEFHEPISLREAKVDYQAELVALRQEVSKLNDTWVWRFGYSGCNKIVFDEKSAGGNAKEIFNGIVSAILAEICNCLQNTDDAWVRQRRERIDACRNLLRQVGIYVPQRYYLVPKADNFTLTPLSAYDTTACSAAVAMLRKHGR